MRLMFAAALALSSLAAAPVAAQTVSTAQPDAIAEHFFQSLKAGNIDEALGGLGKMSPLLGKKLAADTSVQAQIELALKGYGPVTGWERIASQPLGTMARRDTYLVQHRDMVTRWRFVYLRTAKGWVPGNFTFEDQAPTWFD